MITYKEIKKRDKDSFLKISSVERLDAMDHLFEEMLELQALYLGITKDETYKRIIERSSRLTKKI